MTTGDLANIESVLGVTLPAAYRAVMLAYPLDPADVNSQIALLDDAKAVTAFNHFQRDEFPGEWQPGYFAVGNSPCGDPYFLDLDTGSAAVWLWDHETHEVSQEAQDFASWLTVQRSLERRQVSAEPGAAANGGSSTLSAARRSPPAATELVDRRKEDTVETTRIDWETFNRVEEGWNRRCRPNWKKFLRACAVALLDRLPPEASEWVAEADQYEKGELSEPELAHLLEQACRFCRDREATASKAELCGLYVAKYRLHQPKVDWPREEFDETCNFIEACIEAGMSNELLNRLLREHFPAAFEKRPWWRFW